MTKQNLAEPGLSSSRALSVAPFVQADVADAHRLTAALRWPHRIEDWQQMLALGRGVAVRDEQGVLVGTGVAWPWGPDVATLGLILVRDDYQRRGIGNLVLDKLMNACRGRSLRLHATEAGVRLYERAGFRKIGEVRQYHGRASRLSLSSRSRPATACDREAITTLDRMVFGADRGALFERLFRDDAKAVVLEDEDGVRAFAVSRRFGRGALIGPVIARSLADALDVVNPLIGEDFTRIDVTDADTGLASALTAAGLDHVDTVTVMVTGEWPTCHSLNTCFALASQAFG